MTKKSEYFDPFACNKIDCLHNSFYFFPQRPFPPEALQTIRSGFLCGFDDQRLPKVCCPDAAILQSTTTATPAPEPPTDAEIFEGHPNRKVLAPLDDCGVIEEPLVKIVNGFDAFIGQFPWLANLGYQVMQKYRNKLV